MVTHPHWLDQETHLSSSLHLLPTTHTHTKPFQSFIKGKKKEEEILCSTYASQSFVRVQRRREEDEGGGLQYLLAHVGFLHGLMIRQESEMNVWEVGPLQGNQENRFAQKSKTNKSQQEKLDPGGGCCFCFFNFLGWRGKTELSRRNPRFLKQKKPQRQGYLWGGAYILCSGTEGLPVAYIGISSLDALDLVPAFLIFIPTVNFIILTYLYTYTSRIFFKRKCICNFVFIYESVIYNYSYYRKRKTITPRNNLYNMLR